MFLLSGALGVILVLWLFQDHFLYSCGSEKQTHDPLAFGLPPLQKKGRGVVLFEQEQQNTSKRRNIFYFYGNGVKTENTWWHVGRLFQVCNCSIYVVEPVYCRHYRHLPYYQDEIVTFLVNSVYQYLKKDEENILMGVSLGTAYALNVFDNVQSSKIQSIILENPFTSVPELVPWPFSWLLFKQWNNLELVKQIGEEQSLLILTSGNDELVSPKMSHDLYNAAPTENKLQFVFAGALHGHAGAHPEYLPLIEKFLINGRRNKG